MKRRISWPITLALLFFFGFGSVTQAKPDDRGPPFDCDCGIVGELEGDFLEALRDERIPVSMYLVNGIKLQGLVEAYDSRVVLLKNSVSQMVYIHAISTVVPARPVRSFITEDYPGQVEQEEH